MSFLTNPKNKIDLERAIEFLTDFEAIAMDEYVINDDLSIDVMGKVVIRAADFIPFNFRYVSGDFRCNHTRIISLKGSPIEIGGSFNCSDTNIFTLEHGPRAVMEAYDCRRTGVTSLSFGPIEVGGTLSVPGGCDIPKVPARTNPILIKTGDYYVQGPAMKYRWRNDLELE